MDQADLFAFSVKALEQLAIPYMIVGSLTSGAYGEPRFTNDIDIVIDPSPEQLRKLCESFPAADFYISVDAAAAALAQRSQFNVIHPESGNKVDFMISQTTPWGLEQLARRQRIPILPGVDAFAARPEDVIISKMLYYQEGGSEKHLRDIAGILKTSGEDVDRRYITQWAAHFLVMDIWQAVEARANEAM